MHGAKITVVCVLLGLPCAAHAVYKCADANGRAVYQDRPCQQGASKVIEAKPNSVDGSLDPEVARHLAEAETKIKARIEKEDSERVARNQRAAAFLHQCNGYLDEIERQSAWLYSISAAVRASAQANIDVARRKYSGAGCDAPNTFH